MANTDVNSRRNGISLGARPFSSRAPAAHEIAQDLSTKARGIREQMGQDTSETFPDETELRRLHREVKRLEDEVDILILQEVKRLQNETELRRLHREVKRLEDEVEILKKAIAFSTAKTP